MIQILPHTNLGLRQLKQFPYQMVKAARAAQAGVQHTIAHTDVEMPSLLLLGKSKLDAMIAALNPLSTLPVVYKTKTYDMTSAGVRIDEIYHLVLGLSNFPGNEKPNVDLDYSGFEKKIVTQGADLKNLVENVVSGAGFVTASHPIASLASVSARKAGGPLVVSSIPNLSLGVVNLLDGGFPIAASIAVELTYETQEYMVAYIKDPHGVVIAAVISEDFNNYLLAHT